MPNHFSSLGFEVADESAFSALAERAAALASPVETSAGTYLHFSDASGAELWLQLGRRRELIGMNPHFRGSARLRVHLTNRLRRRNDTPLDAAFHAWAEPEPGEEHRAYPFVFDCPCAGVYEPIALPGTAELQVAAFAHELEVYASLEAFELDQHARGQESRAQCFIPAGLFRTHHEGGEPQSTALLTGRVVESARRRNGLTNGVFDWARVASLAGEYDLLIDASLTAEPPVVGGVVHGLFWLSAALPSHEKPR